MSKYVCVIGDRKYDVDTRSAMKCADKYAAYSLDQVVTVETKGGKAISQVRWSPEAREYYRCVIGNENNTRSKYCICYHTGAGDLEADTIKEAKVLADCGAGYTQHDITIEDANGNVLYTRRWWGTEYDPDEDCCKNPILFGDFGFYGDWERYDD